MRSAGFAGSLLLLLLLVPAASAAAEVKAGEPELLVASNVTDITPASGDKFIVWVDERTGNNEIFIQFLPEGDEYRLSNHRYDDSEPAADGQWVSWITYELARPEPGQTLAEPSYDLVVYDVEGGRKVHQIRTQDRNEWSPSISGNRLAFRTDPHDDSKSRVELMELAGDNAFKPCVVRDNGRRQYEPALTGNHLVFRELSETQRWNLVHTSAACGAEARVLSAENVSVTVPVADGGKAAWVETDPSGKTRVRVWDLEAGRSLQLIDPPVRNGVEGLYRNLAIRGDMVLSEVVFNSQYNLWAWCLPDGQPQVLPGARPDATLPRLTSWGSVIYLDIGRSPVNLYQRYVGCGELPPRLTLNEGSPGFELLLLVAAAPVAFLLRRRSF